MRFGAKPALLLTFAVLVPAYAGDKSSPAMTTFGFPTELASQYTKYVDAIKQQDYAAISLILTPDFTRTYEGVTVSHKRALIETHQLVNLMGGGKSHNDYQITIDKAFVKADKATVYVEESLSDSGPATKQDGNRLTINVTGISYSWTHHWVKTSNGWKLCNITRRFH